jgi:DNA mismatch repair protein MSH5
MVGEVDEWGLRELEVLYSDIVDEERTRNENRLCIRAGVDERLDSLRHAFSILPDRLSQAAHQIAREVSGRQSTIRQLNVVYFPQIGYLVAAPVLHQFELLGLFSGEEEWQLMFVTEKIAYFKCPLMRSLDNELGDIHADIVDLEIEYREQLRAAIDSKSEALISIGETAGILDCLVSLAEAVRENDLQKTSCRDIQIRDGRHILQERYVQNFIPNDFIPGNKRIIVITGPNSSGKSCFMKQIGVNAILSQSFGYAAVGAASSIPLFDKLYCRIKTIESVGGESSAFQCELEQIRTALECSTPDSLLLVDEFGRGTLAEDGCALLAGLMEHLVELPHPPLTIIVTHFTEVIQLISERTKESIEWLQMDIYEPTEEESMDPTFMFRVVPGLSSRSLGLQCAASAGVPKSVLQRAKEIHELLGAGVCAADISWALVGESEEQVAIDVIKEAFGC